MYYMRSHLQYDEARHLPLVRALSMQMMTDA
jgi:hypothetical protein